ncbi:MAG: diguanylate cyclase [Planctomycetes bacterium]|nr:diguanylate cyclase [Planctomycetota bacterium]
MNDSSTRAADGRRLFSVAQIQHVLRTEFGRGQRYRYPLSVLVLSVDQLGAVRDRLGYDAKESVVDGIVRLLAESTRSSDFLGRTPDDRLVAVVPHTDAAGARLLGDRLVTGARALAAPGAPGERFTISIGATSTADGEPLFHDVLLTAAEAAQAEAVAQGGDRFVARPPVPPGP